jgi:hypothetical protein
MRRSILGLIGVAILVTFSLAEDAKPGSQFGKDIRVPANIGFSTDISKDGQAATLIFENLTTEVGQTVVGAAGAFNQTANQPKVFTVNVPYSTDQRSVTMHMDLRGFISVDPGASVRLVACVGDATKVIDVMPVKEKTVKFKGKSKEKYAPKPAGQQSGDFEGRVEFTLQTHAAKPVCQITLFLLAEHETDKKDSGGALLVVDSLDLEINKSAKATLKQ